MAPVIHHLYGTVGDFGNGPADIAAVLKAAGNKPVQLRINSPGGSAFDGVAIFNLLAQHKPGVEIDIDGLAASAASIIAMAGSKIRMSESALLMIHDPSGITAGTADDHEATADALGKLRDSLATIYTNRTGIDRAVIETMMADETWLTPEQALEQKFIDEVTPALRLAASFDLSTFNYRKAPTMSTNATNATSTTPPSDEFQRGYNAARQHLTAALKDIPDAQFILDQFIAGRTLAEAKATFDAVQKATAKLKAENERLAAIAGTQGALSIGARAFADDLGDNRSDLPVEEMAAAEFKADAQLRKTFTNEKAYVAFRKAQAAGRIAVFGKPKIDPLAIA